MDMINTNSQIMQKNSQEDKKNGCVKKGSVLKLYFAKEEDFHAFSESISPTVNVIARMKSELPQKITFQDYIFSL